VNPEERTAFKREMRLVLIVCAILLIVGVALIESVLLNPQPIPGGTSTTSSSSSTSLASLSSSPSTIPVGAAPYGISYDPANSRAYVAVTGSASIAVIDNRSTVADEISLGGAADFLAFDPADSYLYASLVGNDSIAVVDTSSDVVVSHISVSTSTGWIVYDPAGQSVIAIDREGNTASVITGKEVTRTLQLAGLPFAAAYDPSNGDVYITDNVGSVSIIDGTTYQLVATLQVAGTGSSLLGIAFDPADSRMYVTSYTDGDVYALNGTSVSATLAGFSQPVGIAFDPSGDMFVADSGDATLTVVSGGGSQVFSLGQSPREALYDQSLGAALVTDYGGSTISIVRA
jgi:DNA-binding beta-propeller fold protein YncE